MVLLRRAVSAVGGVVRLSPVSRVWQLQLHLMPRLASGSTAPASTGRPDVRPPPPVQPVGAAPSVRQTRVTPAAAARWPVVVAQAEPGGAHVIGERWRTARLAPAGGALGEPGMAASGRAITGEIVIAAVRHTVQRVLERGRRLEEHTAAGDPMSGYPHRLARDGGWTLILPPAAVTQQQLPARQHSRDIPAGLTPRRSDPPQTLGAPPTPPRIDVEQLADQVVRRIDDRIIAHRERLGRI
jgi:hypothetical protein